MAKTLTVWNNGKQIVIIKILGTFSITSLPDGTEIQVDE